MALEEKSCVKVFGGFQKTFSHYSKECNCSMKFAIYLPPKSLNQKCPVVYWLSGLTCTEQNVITKSGIQQSASKYGLIIVCPDTSPRGDDVPDEPDSYDFGKGAGFYLDATKEPWNKHYKMYSYITQELPSLIESSFPIITGKQGIVGHSMGGHGALVCSLKNPGKYVSVSAFAPICNPTQCPWGVKAFSGYLGADSKSDWDQYDCVELIKSGKKFTNKVLIDQGDGDNFLSDKQLLPDHLEKVCKEQNIPLELRIQWGYDHSYFFIATFIDSHLEFHSKLLHPEGSGE